MHSKEENCHLAVLVVVARGLDYLLFRLVKVLFREIPFCFRM